MSPLPLPLPPPPLENVRSQRWTTDNRPRHKVTWSKVPGELMNGKTDNRAPISHQLASAGVKRSSNCRLLNFPREQICLSTVWCGIYFWQFWQMILKRISFGCFVFISPINNKQRLFYLSTKGKLVRITMDFVQTSVKILSDFLLKTPRKPASGNVVCLCRLLNFLANFSNLCLHTGKQCGPWSDCSYRSSLIWVHTVCKNDF